MIGPLPIEILRCPATGKALLHRSDNELTTDDGSRSYPIVDGIPVLIDDERSSLFSIAAVSASKSVREERSRARKLARLLVPSESINVGTKERIQILVDRIVAQAGERRPRVLVIGGGEVGRGVQPLLQSEHLDVVETDVYLGPRTDLACDAHSLPFVDGVFDAVLIQGVLGHVVEPSDVVSEIHRVLRSRGLVYAETAFMQQVVEGPYDFARYTDLGHRRLFRMFEQIQRGVAVGPATSLLWAVRYFARSLPRRSALSALVIDKFVTTMLFWLKYLDLILASHRGATDAASGVYFLGRRDEYPISDADILKSYCGSVGSVTRWRGNTDIGNAEGF